MVMPETPVKTNETHLFDHIFTNEATHNMNERENLLTHDEKSDY